MAMEKNVSRADQVVAKAEYEFRDDWTGQVEEEAIDPDRPIVDSHIHFFTENELFPKYVLADYQQDIRAHNIRQTVYIQCMEAYRTSGPEHLKPVGETEHVARIAAEAANGPAGTVRFGAIIAGAQLIQGASVREALEAHLEASSLVRGVRDMALWDESEEVDNVPEATGPNLYEEPAFREGFAELSRLGLCFDAHQYHTQLSYVVDLARAFPDTAIVVDHLGSPLGAGPYAGKREEVFVEWRQSILELSTCANISMKLGGLAMPWCGFGFDEAARPPSSDELIAVQGRYYDHVIQCFGPNRCMFESNFPVDKVSLSYTVLWNSFKKMAAGYSEDEKEALFGGTATRVYQLDPV